MSYQTIVFVVVRKERAAGQQWVFLNKVVVGVSGTPSGAELLIGLDRTKEPHPGDWDYETKK